MYLKAWQSVHKNVIEDFLHFLNKRSGDYILKGGTALMMCYGLDRFSEDIDGDTSISHAAHTRDFSRE